MSSPATTAPKPASLKSIQRPGMLLGIPDCSAITSSDTLIGYRRKRRRDAESRTGANEGAAIPLPPQDRANPSSGCFQRSKRRESEGIIAEITKRIAMEKRGAPGLE